MVIHRSWLANCYEAPKQVRISHRMVTQLVRENRVGNYDIDSPLMVDSKRAELGRDPNLLDITHQLRSVETHQIWIPIPNAIAPRRVSNVSQYPNLAEQPTGRLIITQSATKFKMRSEVVRSRQIYQQAPC